MLKIIKKSIKKILNKRGFILYRPATAILHGDPLHIGGILFSRKLAQFEFFYDKVKNVEGDVIESGIWWGYGILAHLHFTRSGGRIVYGFDSFAGHSQPTKKDAIGGKFAKPGHSFAISQADVWKTLEMGTEMSRHELQNFVKIIPGWIQETMPKFKKENINKKIALVHCDPDLYEPIYYTLTNIWDMLQKSGIIIIGRLNNPEYMGKTEAVNDFLKTIPSNSYALESKKINELETYKEQDLYYIVKNT